MYNSNNIKQRPPSVLKVSKLETMASFKLNYFWRFPVRPCKESFCKARPRTKQFVYCHTLTHRIFGDKYISVINEYMKIHLPTKAHQTAYIQLLGLIPFIL